MTWRCSEKLNKRHRQKENRPYGRLKKVLLAYEERKKLLETQYDPESGNLCFMHDESEPLKADAVVVDETSMVDILLMAALLKALKPQCRLILVGDPDQLPSVGAGNLFSDLFCILRLRQRYHSAQLFNGI